MAIEPIIVERSFEASPETIWQALTNPEEMKKWYFDIPGFEPKVGHQFQFTGENEGRTFLHLCEVQVAIPQQKLAHTWRYEGQPGDTLVTFELTPENKGTRVKLIHAGTETFPKDNPDLARKNFEAGWNFIIGTGLQDYLEKENKLNK
ncbi:SRPBCC domain-containing protein [Nibribacter koreensis]|uniref:SRPBCC domain-containing protein n=1 Tax=Nibribacter koreensis TaxID=1084519 RepID=A0ABP8FBB3_9BACT